MSLSEENRKSLIEYWGDRLGGDEPDDIKLWHFYAVDIEALMNAVRAEERARAAEVMRKTADDLNESEQHIAAHFVMEDRAAYLNDSREQVAENAKCSTDDSREGGAV